MRRWRVFAVLAVAALVFAACGGDDDDDAAGTNETTTAASTTTTGAPETGGDDLPTTVSDHLATVHSRTDIDHVTVESGAVVVFSDLADDAYSDGEELCNQAAMVAYAGDVTALVIKSAGEVTLANGTSEGGCAAAG